MITYIGMMCVVVLPKSWFGERKEKAHLPHTHTHDEYINMWIITISSDPFACSKIRLNLFSTPHGCIILTGLFDFLGTTFCTVGYIYI